MLKSEDSEDSEKLYEADWIIAIASVERWKDEWNYSIIGLIGKQVDECSREQAEESG